MMSPVVTRCHPFVTRKKAKDFNDVTRLPVFCLYR